MVMETLFQCVSSDLEESIATEQSPLPLLFFSSVEQSSILNDAQDGASWSDVSTDLCIIFQ